MLGDLAFQFRILFNASTENELALMELELADCELAQNAVDFSISLNHQIPLLHSIRITNRLLHYEKLLVTRKSQSDESTLRATLLPIPILSAIPLAAQADFC